MKKRDVIFCSVDIFIEEESNTNDSEGRYYGAHVSRYICEYNPWCANEISCK